MRPAPIIFGILLIFNTSNGQSIAPMIISSAGQSLQHPMGISLDYSIGEIAVQTYQNVNGSLSEGLLQPSLILPTSIRALRSVNINIYPNPTRATFKIETNLAEEIMIELRDLSGKLLEIDQFHQNKQIDIRRFRPGTYILNMRDGQDNLYFVPLIKI